MSDAKGRKGWSVGFSPGDAREKRSSLRKLSAPPVKWDAVYLVFELLELHPVELPRSN